MALRELLSDLSDSSTPVDSSAYPNQTNHLEAITFNQRSFRFGEGSAFDRAGLNFSREPFIGNNHAQVFLHYNNVDGPYGENCVFDGRPHLGLPPAFKSPEKQKAMREADQKLHEEQVKSRKK